MSNERNTQEVLYLVDEAYYLHVKEQLDGFAYTVYDRESKAKQYSGVISWEDMNDSHIRSNLACARTLAINEVGLNGERVAQVALRTLDQFPEARRAYRRAHRDDPHDHSIRFITPNYDELFRIPDGGTIRVEYPDSVFSQKCEYIDDYHTLIGGTPYHICQFAEILEKNGGRCIPEPEVLADRAAWNIGRYGYLMMQATDDGWDYTILDKNFHALDGGQLDTPGLSITEAREEILSMHKMSRSTRILTDFDMISEKAAEEASRSVVAELRAKQAEARAPFPHCSVKGEER